MWALGVITYFLLCGYTPFDRQNSMDEMHAILNAEYQFAPMEYWQGVSETGKNNGEQDQKRKWNGKKGKRRISIGSM